jgi:L-iditol 2-dehydrogenase
LKALTLDINPLRWLLCKGVGRVHAGVFWSRCSNLRYRDVPAPVLPGPEWVRVRTRLGGICGTDLAMITQRTHPASILRPFTSFPIVLGHENVGVIEEAGAGVADWPMGARVVVEPALSCAVRGIAPPCAQCAAGRFALCAHFTGTDGGLPAGTMLGLNAFTGGSWSPEFVAHATQLHAVPEALTDEQAVLVDPLACGLHAVLRRPPESGERVLVQGAGIIALGVVLGLRALGFGNEVVALVRHDYQADRFVSAGASRVIRNPRDRDRAALYDELADAFETRRVSSIFGNHTLNAGADVVYECTGSGLGLSDAIKCARARGTVVAAGTSQIHLVDTTSLWFREVTVLGAYGRQIETHAGCRQHTYDLVMALMADGRLPVDGLLTHVFPVAEYRRAFATLVRRGKARAIKAAFRHA